MGTYYDEITIYKAKQAEPTVVKAILTNERHMLPCDAKGVVQSFTNAFTFMRLYEGMIETTNGWTFSKKDSVGVRSSMDFNRVAIIEMTEDVAYIDITATKAGLNPATLRMMVVKSLALPNAPISQNRGTATLAQATSSTAWSSDEAAQVLSNAGFGSPINRDIVTLYNAPAGFSQTRFYDNGAWLQLDAYLSGNMLIDGTLSATKISADTISAREIKSGSATEFTEFVQVHGNGVVSFPFTMKYAGIASAIGIVDYTFTGASNDTNFYFWMDNFQKAQVVSTSFSIASVTSLTGAYLNAGAHTLYLQATTTNPNGNHTFLAMLLRSYR